MLSAVLACNFKTLIPLKNNFQFIELVIKFVKEENS